MADPAEDRLSRSFEQLSAVIGVGGKPAALDQRSVARALTFTFIDTMKHEKGYDKPVTLKLAEGERSMPLYALLTELVDKTWPDHPLTDEEKDQHRTLLEALNQLKDTEVQHRCLKTLVRAGHLHQMAGLVARNLLLQQNGGATTAETFLRKNGSKRFSNVDEAIAALARPSVELTLTAHPTNTNGLASMNDQRRVAQEISALREGRGSEGALRAALKRFATTELLPMDGEKLKPLSVQGEIDYMIYFLRNLYDDLDQTYDSIDTAMKKSYGADYHPEKLTLNLKFHSWGSSGDKDGNNKVTAHTTLYAIAAHKHEALVHYSRALEAITPLPESLRPWQKSLSEALTETDAVMIKMEEILHKRGSFNEGQINYFSGALKIATGALKAENFIKALEDAYPSAPAAIQKTLLSLTRKVRVFGMSFGQIEYRETAEQYTRIVAAMVPNYEGMNEEARRAALTQLLTDSEAMKKAYERLYPKLMWMAHVPYGKVGPIAYQTLQRMALARDFPDAIDTNVLAECKQTSHMLEALVVQHAVTKDGERAKLNIVPLFEEAQVLKRAPEIVRAALENPAYRQHLTELPKTTDGKSPQQVQLAHSDNARRAGMPAARGLIFDAHYALRNMIRDHNRDAREDIDLQFYEGGSQSDPYRGGVRAVSAMVNEFGLFKFAKMTFQGGDLLNYLNLPRSSFRLFVRNITNSAAHATPHQLTPEDRKCAEALVSTREDYEQLFKSEEFKDFMDKIGYKERSASGNVGTRAGGRVVTDGQVSPETMRTISFSETLQHAGIVPTWIGARKLTSALQEQFGQELSPKKLQKLYHDSPIFNDAIDRILFGVARSNMENLGRRVGNHSLMPRMIEEYTNASLLALEAYTGEKVAAKDPAALRQLVIDKVFPHVKEVFADQDSYLSTMRAARRAWIDTKPEGSDERKVLSTLLHNAGATVYHGRLPLLDDPTYGRLYSETLGIERPYVPACGNSRYR